MLHSSMIIYQHAKPEDTLRLSILFQQVYIQSYALEGITVEFANFISQRFAPDRIRKTINEQPDSIIVAYNKDHPIGVAELDFQNKCPIDNLPGAELNKLYVLERFCSKGIGGNLLKKAEEKAIEKGFAQLWLEVWLENPRAIQFYEKQHYQPVGVVDFPMETNTYQNMVMWKELTGI